MVAAIVARAAAPRTALGVLVGWRRPALAAAAAIAAVSVGLLWWDPSPVAAAPEGEATVAEALEVPQPVQDWIVEGRSPAHGDLYVALDEMP